MLLSEALAPLAPRGELFVPADSELSKLEVAYGGEVAAAFFPGHPIVSH